jgi:uncharacterized protein (TIGR02266 family)
MAAEKPNRQPESRVTLNRRVSPRVAVTVNVSMQTEHNFYAGLTENISEGGLFIATYEEFPLGTLMDMTVTLPDIPPIQVRGEVRWVREYNEFTAEVSPGIGVRFLELSPESRRVIETFLRARSPILFET